MKKQSVIPVENVQKRILFLRGERVLIDADLAALFGVATRRLNEQVRRNHVRFPADFMFQLTLQEKEEVIANCDHLKRLRFSPNLPYAFTEHGAIMVATVLSSPRAVQMTVFVVRAFVKMRSTLNDTQELARKLAKLEKELKERLGVHETAIVDVLQRIMNIIDPPPEPEQPKRRIGFGVEEPKAVYHAKRKRPRN